MITQNQLKKLLDYNPETGVLTWRNRPREDFASDHGYKVFNTRSAGRAAGAIDAKGYIKMGLTIDGVFKNYWAHRLIWLHVNGETPNQIDHINQNKADNRIKNLRDVDNATNRKNQSRYITNTSGITGVSWHKASSKWCAQIKINGKSNHLGLFKTLEEAAVARREADDEHGFHPNHGKKKANTSALTR